MVCLSLHLGHDTETGCSSMEPEGSLADDMFRAQKRFMTSFGQQVLKDRRALEAYPYKILRRVVVTDCGRIS